MKADKVWLNHTLTHGVVLGISLSIIEFAALYVGLFFRPALFNVFAFLITISVFIAIRKFRETHLKGLINFGDAFLTGLLVCGFAGFIWAIYRFFQFKLTPGLLEALISNYTAGFEKSNMAKADIELLIEIYNKYFTPVTIAILNTFFLAMLAGGSIITLLMSYILQRKELPKYNEF